MGQEASRRRNRPPDRTAGARRKNEKKSLFQHFLPCRLLSGNSPEQAIFTAPRGGGLRPMPPCVAVIRKR